MAKNTKGGLGRGLSSLLGNTNETASERILVTQKDIDEENQSSHEGVSVTTSFLSESAKEDKTQDLTEEEVAFRELMTRGTTLLKTSSQLEGESAETKDIGVVGEVGIDKLVPNPNQPRTNFHKVELEELAASIARDGLLQPILVRKTSDGVYQIIAGERRWQACKRIGLTTVPVRIKDATEEQALELALIENIQRADLSPIEEAYGYRRLMEHQGLTQAEVAQMLSKGRSTIANALRLLDLPLDAQQLLFEEKITAGHARAILSVPTKEGREKLTNKLLSEKLSVRETEAIARLLSAQGQKGTKTKGAVMPKSFKIVARSLKERLSTDVKVKTGKDVNKIEIAFKDEDDLKRICQQLLPEE